MQTKMVIGDSGGDVIVYYDVSTGFRGNQYTPPEESVIEITKVVYKDVDVTEILEEKTFEYMIEKITKIEIDKAQGRAEAKADFEYEQMKERRLGL